MERLVLSVEVPGCLAGGFGIVGSSQRLSGWLGGLVACLGLLEGLEGVWRVCPLLTRGWRGLRARLSRAVGSLGGWQGYLAGLG